MNEYGIGATDAGLFDATPNEDLTGYEGHGAFWNGTAWQLASAASADETKNVSNFTLAVIVQGASTTEKLELAYVTQGGYIEGKAGTGGVSAGDYVVTEYAASGTDRGRFISTSELHEGQVVWGKARTAVAEDGLFTLDLAASFESVGQWSAAPTEIATVGAGTLTAAQICTGSLSRDCAGAGRTDSLATGTAIAAAMVARGYVKGQTMRCTFTNVSDAAEASTIQEDSAGDATLTLVTAGGDLVLSRNETSEFLFTMTTTALDHVACLFVKA